MRLSLSDFIRGIGQTLLVIPRSGEDPLEEWRRKDGRRRRPRFAEDIRKVGRDLRRSVRRGLP